MDFPKMVGFFHIHIKRLAITENALETEHFLFFVDSYIFELKEKF